MGEGSKRKRLNRESTLLSRLVSEARSTPLKPHFLFEFIVWVWVFMSPSEIILEAGACLN